MAAQQAPSTPDRTLLATAARHLADPNESLPVPGHWPSWRYPHVPDGLALCVTCWRVISAQQLGTEVCIPYGTRVDSHQECEPQRRQRHRRDDASHGEDEDNHGRHTKVIAGASDH
jgi:hypothetical protein